LDWSKKIPFYEDNTPLTSPQACTRDQKKHKKKVCGALSFPTTTDIKNRTERKKRKKTTQKKPNSKRKKKLGCGILCLISR